MENAGTYRLVTAAELAELLERDESQGITDLAVLGPRRGEELGADPGKWPEPIRGCQVYQFRERLDSLAERIARLSSLKKLVLWGVDLGANGARWIAEHLGQLNSLDIANNKIGASGAEAIAKHLDKLTSLNVAGNKIGEAGARAIAEHLGQLNTLSIGENKIGEAGARAIAEHLDKLKSLTVASNDIGEAGARAIAEHLGQLGSLSIGDNYIGDLGARAIAEHLRQLDSLNAGNNNIGEAGARAIAEHLSQLKSLSIWNNNISEAGARAIAEHLGQLNLLDVGHNNIGDSGACAIAEHLGQLETLWLDHNSFGNTAVAAVAVGLPKLRHLVMSNNPRIEGVAPLARLPALRNLNLRDTSVADLSPFTEQILAGLPVRWEFTSGDGIYVQDCPLVNPTVEIARQGPEAVRNYFREIAAQGIDRLYEAKVLILGAGGAGKTSLLRRLYFPDLQLPTVDETTRGIDVHRQEFQAERGRAFRLNVWDFGGQQIYHATHQFFLTKNSLYILVDDTKTNDRSIHDEGFKFWLEVVETLSDSSPLLVFQNEKGGRSKAIDEPGIKGRFPNFKETYRGNLDEPGSADKIRQAIQYFVQQLPHVGEEVPAKWVSIRRALEDEAQQKPFISQDEYFSIYGRHLAFDRTKALHLSRYLHDLGVFLHFQDDALLRKTVILQNQWATDAVFRVLDNETVKRAKGHFTQAECRRLWYEPEYVDMDQEMLGLMEKFELCYRLTDTREPTWLAPRLLPPSKPAALAGWAAPTDLVVSYRYTFLPRGLVNRLMVRQHRFVKQVDMSWEHGAFFEQDDTQVLVEATAKGNEIELRARGPESKALLSVLAGELESLNATFKGLEGKVDKLAPCICSVCRKDAAPGMYEVAELVSRKRDNKPTIECRRKPYENVSVVELLEGLRPEHLPDWARSASRTAISDADDSGEILERRDEPLGTTPAPRTEKTIRIFLASSSELKDNRDEFELYFRQQNDRLRKEGLYLQVDRWENFLDAMSQTRLQDEYNKAVCNCDIFVSLFMTKTGKFTEEEFDVAHEAFKSTGKPLIYTFFKEASIATSSMNLSELQSLQAFKDKLKNLGHFHTRYDGVEHLKRQFMDQLQKLQEAGRV